MKGISLHNRNVAIFITDEAYEAIVQIVKENRICEYCTNRYTQTNPRVWHLYGFSWTGKRSRRPWDASRLLHFCLSGSVFL